QLAGHRLEFAPDALVSQRFRTTIPSLAQQQFRYGRSGPWVQRAYAELGVPGADNRLALQIWRRLLVTVPDLWHSRERRGRWVKLAAFQLGRLEGSLRARVVCL